MIPEATLSMEKARECLTDAISLVKMLPRVAGREAYLAAFHAAEALVSERTGKAAKTHRGLRSQFYRLIKDDPSADSSLFEFLGRAYELKSMADYGTGAEAVITANTAAAAVESATRFVDAVAGLLEARQRP